MIYSNHFTRNIFTGDLLQQLSILLDINNKYYLYFIFGEKLFHLNDTKVCPSAKSTMQWRGIVSTLLTPPVYPQKTAIPSYCWSQLETSKFTKTIHPFRGKPVFSSFHICRSAVFLKQPIRVPFDEPCVKGEVGGIPFLNSLKQTFHFVKSKSLINVSPAPAWELSTGNPDSKVAPLHDN